MIKWIKSLFSAAEKLEEIEQEKPMYWVAIDADIVANGNARRNTLEAIQAFQIAQTDRQKKERKAAFKQWIQNCNDVFSYARIA